MSGKCKILWGLMAGQRLRYGVAIAAMVVSVAATFVPPLIGRAAIDYVIAGEELYAPQFVKNFVEWIGGQSMLARNLWIAGSAMVGLIALSGLFGYLKGRWASIASESIARNLRNRLYDHLQHLPCSYHDKAETGDLVQRCSSDVETIRLFLAMQVVEIGRGGVTLAVAIPIMLAMNARMALLAMVLLGPILIFSFAFFIKVRNVFKRMDEAEGAMTATLTENLAGIRVVRAFARQGFECEKFGEKNARYRNRWLELMRVMAWFWSCSDVMCMAQYGIVLVAGGYYIAAGTMTVGTFFAFFMFVNMYLWPIRRIGKIMADLGKATVSIGRVGEILDAKREDHTDQVKITRGPAERASGEIVFENISFTHGDGTHVLDNISLRVEPGRSLAILGPSGSGKSTLINLLLRLYDYRDGSIHLDGRELREMDRKFVRSQIGVVLQEPFLYSRSLRENIKLGRSAAHDEEIFEAASAAHVHDAIAGFEGGYDTVVGERGVTLSGGQQQRVALARAILKNPPILILDDALSSVDTRTENLILQALRQRHGTRTTLIIAHRLSTLMAADRTIVLDRGRIVQFGTHEELLKEPGLYRRLWEIQSFLEDDLGRNIGKKRGGNQQ